MNRVASFSAVLVVCGGLLALPGCGATDGGSPAEGAPAAAPASSEQGLASTHPDPVATIPLRDGSRVELYDFGGSVFVVEAGHAGNAPLLPSYRDLMQTNRIVDLAVALRSDLPVPNEIYALQAKYPVKRIPTAPGDIGESPTRPGAHAEGSGGEPIESARVAPGHLAPDGEQGCNNRCCDNVWTKSTLCSAAFEGWNHSWYLYNYGWSYADYYGQFWSGTACSAVGTSTYSVSCNGNGGTWSVAESDYISYGWFNYDTTCDGSVNSQNNQHLHTFCGEAD